MSIVVHVGQCGNQLGDAFWRLAADTTDASVTNRTSASSQKKNAVATAAKTGHRAGHVPPRAPVPTLYADCFFHRRSRRARCILVDTEPKVIRAVLRTGSVNGAKSDTRVAFEPAHMHYEQSGRGNNWAMGYNFQTHQRNVLRSKRDVVASSTTSTTGARTKKKLLLVDAAAAAHAGEKRELVERVMESLRHEIEALDAYRGTMLMHSLGGGTGAGLGCRLLETIRDTYPRSYLGAVSVAPSRASGDTPLQNYNALFTLQHLQEHTDCVLYKENDELLRTAAYWKAIVATYARGAPSPRDVDETNKVTLREMNALVAADVAGLMFPVVRPKGAEQSLVAQPFDMAKLVHDCCPLSTTKFLDVRTGVLRTASTKTKKAGADAVDPLFHALPPSLHTGSGDDDDASMTKLLRHTTQSFPRWTSTTQTIAASAVLRHGAGAALDEPGGVDPSSFSASVAAALPRLHLGNHVDVVQSRFAPFQMYGGKASVTIALNSGHATASISHFLDRGRRQFDAHAYTHWYKQYGLEDGDFENAFEQCTKIVQHYDELLHP